MRKVIYLSVLMTLSSLSGEELGYETTKNDFGEPLLSGFYQSSISSTLPGGFPDISHPWLHLINSRHSNSTNNFQLQIASAYSENDRLFFRKIASHDLSTDENGDHYNPDWHELATRGVNYFSGNQFIDGRLTLGDDFIFQDYSDRSLIAFPRDSRLDIGSIGGFVDDSPGSHYWRGVHFSGDWITVGGAVQFPRLVIYSEGETKNDPGYINYYIRAGNASTQSNIHVRAENGGSILLNPEGTDGNVGIGIRDPQNKLDVNGTIRAKEIIVESDWADFVFEDDYELMPLPQVQSYIQENKRLPGLPSAEEVQEQGVSLGEMQTVMLQKMEEMTLHMITLQNKNTELQALNTELLKRLEKLEEAMNHE